RQHLYLRRYERSRKHSAALMLAGMQGFREMFSGSHPAKISAASLSAPLRAQPQAQRGADAGGHAGLPRNVLR
ncbi:hypothetical protein CKJ90_32505, partial [Klebsiella pneumoniae]